MFISTFFYSCFKVQGGDAGEGREATDEEAQEWRRGSANRKMFSEVVVHAHGEGETQTGKARMVERDQGIDKVEKNTVVAETEEKK